MNREIPESNRKIGDWVTVNVPTKARIVGYTLHETRKVRDKDNLQYVVQIEGAVGISLYREDSLNDSTNS